MIVRLEANRQSLEGTKDSGLVILQCLGLAFERHILEAPKEGAQREFSFESGEGSADAKVSTVAKREVAVINTVDVEPCGLGKAGWVAVGGTEPEIDELTLLEEVPLPIK